MKAILLYILIISTFGSLHFSFIGGYEESHILFLASSCLLSIVSVFYSKKKFTYNLIDIVVAIYVLFHISTLTFYGNRYGTDMPYLVATFWMLLLAFKRLFTFRQVARNVLWIIVFFAGIEIIIGFGQLYGVWGNSNSLFQLGGSFGNPGPFAGYLSVCAPMTLSTLFLLKRRKKYENLMYLFLACFIFELCLVAISCSRGAYVACFIGTLMVLESYYSIFKRFAWKKHFKLITASLIVLGICVSIFGYYMKSDSADGRVLIWKITMGTPHKSLLVGDGISSFGANYCKWQREYFATNHGTELERKIADYVTCAYNEFIETYVDQGILGLGLMICIVVFSLRTKVTRKTFVLVGSKASLIGFIVLCCVSYPFQIHLMYLHFVTILALLLSGQDNENVKMAFNKRVYIEYLYCAISLLVFIFGVHQLYGYSLLKKGRECIAMGNVDSAIAYYQQAYPIIGNDGTFLLFYGSALSTKGNTVMAINTLRRAEQKSSDPAIFILLGNLYKQERHFVKSRVAYQAAINTIPSRIYPKYLLVKLLDNFGYQAESCILAKRLLSTKEKVPTVAGKEIKDEMRLIIQKYQTNSQ